MKRVNFGLLLFAVLDVTVILLAVGSLALLALAFVRGLL